MGDSQPDLQRHVERKAGLEICRRALRETESWDEARAYRDEMLEAFGLVKIPDDLPMACGHPRIGARDNGANAQCGKCKREKDNELRKGKHAG